MKPTHIPNTLHQKRAKLLCGWIFVCSLFLVQSVGVAQPTSPTTPPAPPTNLVAANHPWDVGDKIDLTWVRSTDDPARVKTYRIYKRIATVGDPPITLATAFDQTKFVPQGTTEYTVTELSRKIPIRVVRDLNKNLSNPALDALIDSGEDDFPVAYAFAVAAVDVDGVESSLAVTVSAITPSIEWFEGSRFWLMIITVTFCAAVIFWIQHARKGKPIKVRKIAGLEAVDEAVGRATEMGRPCLYIPGIQDINEIQTIAGLTILSRVAKTAAEYDAKVEVPTSRSLVMATARETVQAAFLAAGRPDAYNEDLIYYVTDEQFGYVAYLQGMMVREKPAACFYMGAFFAESLILAETGNGIGAIQVAGTAMPAQLPFFVAACDYTLIGEEFFAASAYLSGSPEELGSLKGQDVGKLIVAVIIVVGVIMASAASLFDNATLQSAVDYLKGTVLK